MSAQPLSGRFCHFDEYEAVWNDILKLRSLGPSYSPVTPSHDTVDVDKDGAEILPIQNLSLKVDGSKVRLPTIVAVVGHPGIGKSVWLLYVLSRLLCASQPVLIPASSEYDIFFCASGAYQIPHEFLTTAISDCLGPECWALADSDDVNPMVPIHYRRTKVSTIQVSAPLKDQVDWLEKRHNARMYFVSPPSLQEYLAACHSQRVSPPLEQSLCRSFYADFGPSIRLALHCCRSLEAYELNAREIVARIKYMDYERFSAMMSHRVLVTRPGQRRADHRLEYVSPLVEGLIRDRLQTAWANNCGDFISMCHRSTIIRCLAAPALELGFHSKLAQGGRCRLTALVIGDSSERWGPEKDTVKWEVQGGYYAHTRSCFVAAKFFSLANPPFPTSFTAYWQPTNRMAFDSLIFDAPSNTVFLFQLPLSELHGTKVSSVLFVRQHFPNATIHYISVSHTAYADPLLVGAAESQWLASKWHMRMNLNAPADVSASELQKLSL
ncbi:hypothetical protein CPB85DRAFT_1249295 [Mucidula mucida]|nr:hypothetical protein CPB85DRAFT_1249295 [Mucidula mucida]